MSAELPWELPEEGTPEEERLAELIGSILGGDGREVLRELRAQGTDLAGMAAAAGLPNDPAMLTSMFEQVQQVLAASGDDPVNWTVAHDVARQTAVQGGDPVLVGTQERTAVEALTVAELWLDAATDLPPSPGQRRAWSRAEWVEATLPTWRLLTEPVAASMSAAFAEALSDQLPESIDELPGPWGEQGATPLGGNPEAMLRQLGSAVFGLQVGQGAGTLAREVFGSTDIGLPLLADGAVVLLPSNVDAFAEGLDAPVEEVRLFLALREAAHTRLYAHAAWLRAAVDGAVTDYARGISIDLAQLEDSFREVDLSDPEALRSAISGGVFAPQVTDEQRAALDRLETVLALVEGWVDVVVAAAAAPHLPHTAALREMIRRRRAAGGPGERTFANLVGLELRPRRSRDAAALWERIAASGGAEARDGVWDHPDLQPTAADLDDPAGYLGRQDAARAAEAEIDQALADILAGDASPEAAPPGEPSTDEGPPG